jgi:hypothetical protein
VLWLYGKVRELHGSLTGLQKQCDETGSIQAGGLSITSSSVASSSAEPPSSVSDLVYNQALRCARDGGLQELVGHRGHAECLYKRAVFLLEVLNSPARPVPFSEAGEPVPSQQDQRVIQGYLNVIQQRSVSLGRSPIS